MATLTVPIAVGSASANPAHAADLGRIVFASGKVYRVAKAAAAITAAASKVLVSAVDATTGERTFVCNTTTSANNALVAGVVPVGQTGSSGTTGLLINDYFLLQVAGDAQVLVLDNSAVGEVLATSTTAGTGGEIGNETTFLQTELGAAFAVVTKTLSQASTNAAGITACRLINLF